MNSRKEASVFVRSIHAVVLSLLLPMALNASWASVSAAASGGPCQADVQRLCGKVQPGKGRLRACLDKHKGELSEACKAKMEKAQADLADAQQACGDDAERVCGDVTPGDGRTLRCLIERKNRLDVPCRLKLEEAGAKVRNAQEDVKEQAESAQDACRGDIARLCKDVKPGGGRIVRCLKSQSGELSGACQKSLP